MHLAHFVRVYAVLRALDCFLACHEYSGAQCLVPIIFGVVKNPDGNCRQNGNKLEENLWSVSIGIFCKCFNKEDDPAVIKRNAVEFVAFGIDCLKNNCHENNEARNLFEIFSQVCDKLGKQFVMERTGFLEGIASVMSSTTASDENKRMADQLLQHLYSKT